MVHYAAALVAASGVASFFIFLFLPPRMPRAPQSFSRNAAAAKFVRLMPRENARGGSNGPSLLREEMPPAAREERRYAATPRYSFCFSVAIRAHYIITPDITMPDYFSKMVKIKKVLRASSTMSRLQRTEVQRRHGKNHAIRCGKVGQVVGSTVRLQKCLIIFIGITPPRRRRFAGIVFTIIIVCARAPPRRARASERYAQNSARRLPVHAAMK